MQDRAFRSTIPRRWDAATGLECPASPCEAYTRPSLETTPPLLLIAQTTHNHKCLLPTDLCTTLDTSHPHMWVRQQIFDSVSWNLVVGGPNITTQLRTACDSAANVTTEPTDVGTKDEVAWKVTGNRRYYGDRAVVTQASLNDSIVEWMFIIHIIKLCTHSAHYRWQYIIYLCSNYMF